MASGLPTLPSLVMHTPSTSPSLSPQTSPAKSDGAPLLGNRSSNPLHLAPSSMSFTDVTFMQRLRKRAGVLVALLVFQSCSSFILASFEALLKKHSVRSWHSNLAHAHAFADCS